MIEFSSLIFPPKLICQRFSANSIKNNSPHSIQTAQKANLDWVWCTDPMHGNVEATSKVYKARRFENISDGSTRLF